MPQWDSIEKHLNDIGISNIEKYSNGSNKTRFTISFNRDENGRSIEIICIAEKDWYLGNMGGGNTEKNFKITIEDEEKKYRTYTEPTSLNNWFNLIKELIQKPNESVYTIIKRKEIQKAEKELKKKEDKLNDAIRDYLWDWTTLEDLKGNLENIKGMAKFSRNSELQKTIMNNIKDYLKKI